MTVTYTAHPRGYRPEAPEAVHWTGDAAPEWAAETACKRDTGGRMLSATPERVTCRECRGVVEATDA